MVALISDSEVGRKGAIEQLAELTHKASLFAQFSLYLFKSHFLLSHSLASVYVRLSESIVLSRLQDCPVQLSNKIVRSKARDPPPSSSRAMERAGEEPLIPRQTHQASSTRAERHHHDTRHGLSQHEASERLARDGPNELQESKVRLEHNSAVE